MKVFCYYNLHKHLWSIKALEGPKKNRVIGHSHEIFLNDAYSKVSEAGRQRVLREQRKNVHAGIVGYLPDGEQLDMLDVIPVGQEYDSMRKLYYNPYKTDKFVYSDTGKAFNCAKLMYLDATDGKRDVIEVTPWKP